MRPIQVRPSSLINDVIDEKHKDIWMQVGSKIKTVSRLSPTLNLILIQITIHLNN